MNLDALMDCRAASEDCNNEITPARVGYYCITGKIEGAFKAPAGAKPEGRDTRPWKFTRRAWNLFFYGHEKGLKK